MENKKIENLNHPIQQTKTEIKPIDPQLLVTLKRGLNYNGDNLQLWMLEIADKKLTVGNIFFHGNFIIRIDKSGKIYKVTPYNLAGVPKPIIDSITSYLISKKMTPYSYEGVSFFSYKNYSISFMPPMDKKIRISEDGTLDGNPNIVLSPVQ